MNEPRKILDEKGRPFVTRPTLKARIFAFTHKLVSTTWVRLTALGVGITFIATNLENMKKIYNIIIPYSEPESPEAPPADIARAVESKNSTDPPPPPPGYSPDELSRLARPTAEARLSQEFADTSIVIVNMLSSPVRVAFSYPPNPEDRSSIGESPFVHRVTPIIEPKTTIEHHESSFGGGVFVAILMNGKWQKVVPWRDLGVQHARKVIVFEENGKIEVKVEL